MVPTSITQFIYGADVLFSRQQTV